MPLQAFGDGRRLALHMRIRRRSSPESAAGHLGVKGNLFRLQAEDFGDSHLIESLKLRTTQTSARSPSNRMVVFNGSIGV